MSDLGNTARELINPHFENLNKNKSGAKIARAYVYNKQDVVILHIVLRKSGNVVFGEPDFHEKLESAFNNKVKYHMSYDGERGGISDPPLGAEKFFDGGFAPLPDAPSNKM
ncbi:MAG: hypothetical protein ACYSUN_14650 [Planctomycetota bacterium]|jgi:hypothetical protein